MQHVGVQGPFIKSRWSHVPITFSQEDLQLKDFPHNDAMVISCVIKGFLVHNVLVDTGSAADIIFAKAFRQMQEPEDKIHDATHPLCGFGGRQSFVDKAASVSVNGFHNALHRFFAHFLRDFLNTLDEEFRGEAFLKSQEIYQR